MQNAKSPKRGPGKAAKRKAALSAQQTIPYLVMHPDGVCQLPGGLYTKTVEYEDINYSVASTEDQTAIFGGWSSFLNYFDSSLPFQLSFINRRSRSRSKYKVNIPPAQDDYDSIRAEFTGMLKSQIAKSNNGIERSKYITFGLPAEGIAEARPRLERVEADVTGNLKRLGVPSVPMDGQARLALLHGQMHPGNREPFRFSWQDIPKTGLGTKDYIAPDSFDFRQSRTFRIGQYWGAASYLQILASELSDKLLAEILELDAEMTVTLHIQTVDQLKAIKTIKGKLSDIGKMKVEEQRKAVRAGYDPDILPPDLITFSKDAAELLADLQSRNERMFLLTFTVINIAPTRQRLENDVFTVGGIAQKYNCAFIDDGVEVGTEICGVKVIGRVSDLPKLFDTYKLLVVTIGNNAVRERIYDTAEKIGYDFPNLIHSSAYVSPYAKMGCGCVLLNNSVVQNGSTVGNGVLLNPGVEVHHDCSVDDFSLIYTNSVVRTYAKVGKRVRIGSNCTVCNNATVSDDADIPDCTAVH